MNFKFPIIIGLLSLLAAVALLSRRGPVEESGEKKRSHTTPVPTSGTQRPASPAGATADGHTGAPAGVRTFSPALAAFIRGYRPPEPAADWRAALSDPNVSAGIKTATVIKLGEERNAEAVPLLVKHLMEIQPGPHVSAQTWRPCAGALIQIGEPAVRCVSERFLVADTRSERSALFYILQTISGGHNALDWLELVRDTTPLVSNEEFTVYWKIGEEAAANEERDRRDWLRLHPEENETP